MEEEELKIILVGRGECFIAVRDMLLKEKLLPVLMWQYGERRRLDSWEGVEVLSGRTLTAPTVEARNPHIIICVGYPRLLPPSVYMIPTLGTINMHTGKLPEYRGRHAINWALLNGEKEIGITVHYLNDNIDQGDIILQDMVPIERNDNYRTMCKKITPKAAKLVVTAVKQIKNGCVYRRGQNEGLSSHHPRRSPSDSRLDWSQTGLELTNKINALLFPIRTEGRDALAFVKKKSGRKVIIYNTVRGECPGEVLGRIDRDTYVVATTDCPIVIKTEILLRKGQILV